jgi:hypothetical protein
LKNIKFTDPEFIGTMPIRQDIEILPADKLRKLTLDCMTVIDTRGKMSKNSFKLGWIIFEKIGLGITNPRSLKKLSITSGDK